MILQIRFDNYRLFQEEENLGFFADARQPRLMCNAQELDHRYVLKSIGLYGANNAGKTNIVSLFKNLKLILSGRPDFQLNQDPFENKPRTRISITYNNNDGLGWLRYEFVYDKSQNRFVSEIMESIRYYPKGSPRSKIILEKDLDHRYLHVLGQDRQDILDLIPSRVPFLFAVSVEEGTLSSLFPYLQSLTKLNESIEVVDMYNIPLGKTIHMLKEGSEKQKQFISAFVQSADVSVNDFYYDPKGRVALKEGADEKALEEFKKYEDVFHLTTAYGASSVPSYFYDSAGTKKIECIASYIYEALMEGKFLVLDELDNGLHHNLSRCIVALFNNLANTRGQLLFTAHDLLLIDCRELMRKDQIYFIYREEDIAHALCLKDVPVSEGGPRETTDILKHYQHGDYTPVPLPMFIDVLLDALEDEGEEN